MTAAAAQLRWRGLDTVRRKAELQAALDTARFDAAGGWLGTSRLVLQPRTIVTAEAELVALAADAGWSPETLVGWALSRPGRWAADQVADCEHLAGATPGACRIAFRAHGVRAGRR